MSASWFSFSFNFLNQQHDFQDGIILKKIISQGAMRSVRRKNRSRNRLGRGKTNFSRQKINDPVFLYEFDESVGFFILTLSLLFSEITPSCFLLLLHSLVQAANTHTHESLKIYMLLLEFYSGRHKERIGKNFNSKIYITEYMYL